MAVAVSLASFIFCGKSIELAVICVSVFVKNKKQKQDKNRTKKDFNGGSVGSKNV